jgi:hypothetical protein
MKKENSDCDILSFGNADDRFQVGRYSSRVDIKDDDDSDNDNDTHPDHNYGDLHSLA